MASFHEDLDRDLNVDTVLQQYMFELVNCTTDLSQAPPTLGDLSPFSSLQQPTGMADGLYDSLYPGAEQASSSLGVQQPILPSHANDQAADPTNVATTGTKRSEAWTAKNRRAQKRFRERQKESSQSELGLSAALTPVPTYMT